MSNALRKIKRKNIPKDDKIIKLKIPEEIRSICDEVSQEAEKKGLSQDEMLDLFQDKLNEI